MTSISYFGKMNSTLGSVVPLAMFSMPSSTHRSLIRVEFLILNPSARWRWPPFPDLTQPPLLTGDHPFSANHTASFQNCAVLLANFEMMNLRLDCMICCIYNKLTPFKAGTLEKSRIRHRIVEIC